MPKTQASKLEQMARDSGIKSAFPLDVRIRHATTNAKQIVALMKGQDYLTGGARIICEAEIAGMEKVIRMIEREL